MKISQISAHVCAERGVQGNDMAGTDARNSTCARSIDVRNLSMYGPSFRCKRWTRRFRGGCKTLKS